jgi:L-malate glycosyltransferase
LARLRVCHVASGDLWAGAEVQIASLLQAFKSDPEIELSAILFNHGTLYDRLTNSRIPVQVVSETQLQPVQLIARLRAHFIEWRPNIVHTHRYKENCLAGLAAAMAGNRPLIVQTVHGIHEGLKGWQQFKMGCYSLLDGFVTGHVAGGAIGVSAEIADCLKTRFPRVPVACIHNGISCVTPAPCGTTTRKELDIPDNAFVVGMVGRLTPIKGLEYLLRALQPLVQEPDSPPIRAIVIGRGPLRPQLESLAGHLGIHRSVCFLGERHDVQTLLPLLDLFVLPSLHEGIPMALLEAMAAGCPVVASQVGGIPEVVRQGIEGTLVPSGNVAALTKAIEDLRSSPERRTQYGIAGRERVLTEFSIASTASRTKAFYRDVATRAS